jgi:hypothetical protein
VTRRLRYYPIARPPEANRLPIGDWMLRWVALGKALWAVPKTAGRISMGGMALGWLESRQPARGGLWLTLRKHVHGGGFLGANRVFPAASTTSRAQLLVRTFLRSALGGRVKRGRASAGHGKMRTLLRWNLQSVYSPLSVPYAVLATKQGVQVPASR